VAHRPGSDPERRAAIFLAALAAACALAIGGFYILFYW